MKRYPLKFRQSTYQETDFYQLMPIGRRPVAPGERISKLVVDTRFTSAVYEKANLTPLLVQTWAFYVPNRLVWDQWIDFIALDDTVVSVPTATGPSPNYFEASSGTKPAFFRRGYKKIYNQYFGDELAGETDSWFANENDDTVNSVGRLLIWDQYRSHLRAGAYTQSVFTATVSGPTATIQLDDLQRALRNNTARRRQKASGDKYVDTMRLMGVELDWRVQMAPEFLGSSQQVIFGTAQQSAGSTDLTIRATNWEGQHQLMIKRPLAFAEHGYIHVLIGFRPLVSLPTTSVPDSTFMAQANYFRPDTAGGPVDSSNPMFERNAGYLRGRNVTGNKQNNNAFFDTSASANSLYPDPAMFVPASTSGPRAVAMISDVSFTGLTPVPALRA